VTISSRLRATSCIILALAVCVGGCGRGESSKKTSQVAAKVNGDEITVHQVNQALSRVGNIPEGQQKQAQQQVLDRLVDQQLLVHQAVEKKLDRDPRIVSAIEASKRQILAQAYLEQVMSGATKANADQVKTFYTEHPELFGQRRVYRFREIVIASTPELQPKLRAELERLDKDPSKDKIMPQLVSWLQNEKVKYQTNVATQAAEQLPMELLGKIHQMKEGDLLLMPRGNATVVSQLVQSQAAPLTQEQSVPYIEQYLHNRKRLEVSNEEMKRLRTAAKIEYVGDFQKRDAAATPAPAATPAEPANPETKSDASESEEALQRGLKTLGK